MRRLRGYLHPRRKPPPTPPTVPPSSSANPSYGITFRFHNAVHVSGSPIEGEIDLNLWDFLEDGVEEVRLEFRGSVTTRVFRIHSAQTETTSVAHIDVPIWKRDPRNHDPVFGTLITWDLKPFSIQLPPELPPTFYQSAGSSTAEVKYALTVVGVRPEFPQHDRRIHVPILIVPKDSCEFLDVKPRLPGMVTVADTVPWRTERTEKRFRRGPWGRYATAQVQLTIPALPALPVYTGVPFVIEVVTTSLPLTRAEVDASSYENPIFPAVPTEFTMLQFKLHRRLKVRAGTLRDDVSSDVATFTKAACVISAVHVETPFGKWQPLKDTDERAPGALGRWVQRSRFRSVFQLACAPSFTTETIDCQHSLELTVPFAGAGTDVHLSCPIRLSSGLDAPTTREKLGSPAPLQALPNFVDMPLIYWDANVDEWDDRYRFRRR